jgi:hypothetical protein
MNSAAGGLKRKRRRRRRDSPELNPSPIWRVRENGGQRHDSGDRSNSQHLFATALRNPFLYQVDLAQNRLVRKARVAPTDDGCMVGVYVLK